MRLIKLFEEFELGSDKQIVEHLLEEIGVEGKMQDLGSVITWEVLYDDDKARTIPELKAILQEHADVLSHDMPGAVIGIKFQRQNSQRQFTSAEYKYCVTAVTIFKKGLKDSLYDWMNSRFGGLEQVREDDGIYSIGEVGNDYFWYEEESELNVVSESELNVECVVYNLLFDMIFGESGFIASPDDTSLAKYYSKVSPFVFVNIAGSFIIDWFHCSYGKRFKYIDFI